MDDELKAIQAELDDVLERLTNYMSSDKLPTEHTEWGEASEEDAAAVILNYAGVHNEPGPKNKKNLGMIIHLYRWAGASQNEERKRQIEFHGEELGSVVAAIDALGDCSFAPQKADMLILSSAASDFMGGGSKWFGESLGLPLVRSIRKKENESAKPPLVIDGYLGKLSDERQSAAMDVFFIHRGKNIPLDEGLFELVGQQRGIKAGTLKNFYYSDKAKKMRDTLKFCEEMRGETIDYLPPDIEI